MSLQFILPQKNELKFVMTQNLCPQNNAVEVKVNPMNGIEMELFGIVTYVVVDNVLKCVFLKIKVK